MQNIQKNTPLANNHISVDCVVIGFDGEQLKVLLVKRAGEDNGEVISRYETSRKSLFIWMRIWTEAAPARII